MSTKKPEPIDPVDRMGVCQERAIRRTWHNAEWWFAIVDVVAVLTVFGTARGLRHGLAPARQGVGKRVGANCHPASVRDRRRSAARQLRQHRGSVPNHPIDSLAKGRALQALAGAGGLRAGAGD